MSLATKFYQNAIFSWRPRANQTAILPHDKTSWHPKCRGPDWLHTFENLLSWRWEYVQAIGSSDLTVLDVEARWPGATHDSYIYDMSFIKMRFLSGEFGNSFLLGDSGYANSSHMLTPITSPNSIAERAYQIAHISTRNAVERLFGVAKRLFPALALGLQIDVATTLEIIVACFILHNMAIASNDPYNDFDIIPEDTFEPMTETENQNTDVRSRIIHQYFSQP